MAIENTQASDMASAESDRQVPTASATNIGQDNTNPPGLPKSGPLIDNPIAINDPGNPTSGGYYVFVITYLVLLSAFGSFVNDMYIPTMPEMVKAFKCTISTCELGLTFGMIGLGIGELLLGPLSDRYGRKPVLYCSLVIFAVGALCCVWSKTIMEFVWWRLMQGVGASGGYFLARTIPADMYKGRALAKVMALVGAINGFAPASAPVIGGFVGKAVGWQGIFWILFGFSLLLVALAPALKESLPKDRRYIGDLKGAFGNYVFLLKKKNFMLHAILKGVALGMVFAYVSSAPFIIQTHYGYNELQFGLFMGFNAIFVAIGAVTALKFRPLKKAAVLAGVTVFVSTLGQAACLLTVNNVWVYDAFNVVMAFCMGMLFTVANTLAMNEGRECAGDASALLGLIGYIFGGVASPLVGIGDVLHSAAFTLVGFAVLVLIFTLVCRVLPADLEADPVAARRAGLPKSTSQRQAEEKAAAVPA